MGILDKIREEQAKREKENVISEEVAIEQLVSFLDYFGMEIQEIESDAAAEGSIKGLISKIRKGYISIEMIEGAPVVKMPLQKSGEVLEFNEPTGRTSVVKNKYKNSDDKLLGVLGQLCGKGYDIMKELKGLDRMNLLIVGGLFSPTI